MPIDWVLVAAVAAAFAVPSMTDRSDRESIADSGRTALRFLPASEAQVLSQRTLAMIIQFARPAPTRVSEYAAKVSMSNGRHRHGIRSTRQGSSRNRQSNLGWPFLFTGSRYIKLGRQSDVTSYGRKN